MRESLGRPGMSDAMNPAKRRSQRTKAQIKGKESEPPKRRRTLWTKEEDKEFRELFALHGKNWSRIASGLSKRFPKFSRSGKACRLRWVNQLNPAIDHTAWRIEEKEKVRRLHKRFGNRWARIAKEMTDKEWGYRTDNMVKNLWNSSLKPKAKQSHLPAPVPVTSMSSEEEDEDEASFNGVSGASTVANSPGGMGPYGYPGKSAVGPPDMRSEVDCATSPFSGYAGDFSLNVMRPSPQMQNDIKPLIGGLPPVQPSGQSMFTAPPAGCFGLPIPFGRFEDLMASLNADNDDGPGAFNPTVQATPGSAAGLTSPPYSHDAYYDLLAEGALKPLSRQLSVMDHGDFRSKGEVTGLSHGDPSTPPRPDEEAPHMGSPPAYSPDLCQTECDEPFMLFEMPESDMGLDHVPAFDAPAPLTGLNK